MKVISAPPLAVLKADNYRSLGLLRKLGFRAATCAQCARYGGETDEVVMIEPDEHGV